MKKRQMAQLIFWLVNKRSMMLSLLYARISSFSLLQNSLVLKHCQWHNGILQYNSPFYVSFGYISFYVCKLKKI